MKNLLKGCVLNVSTNKTAKDFDPVKKSIGYQAVSLGVDFTEMDFDSKASLSFDFKTPRTSPIQCHVTRWADPLILTPVSEHSLQAACGLMSVHGRAAGGARGLGIPYVSSLTAVLALQGAAAAAIAQINGQPTTKTAISMAAAGLLSVAQYLAGATAEEGPESFPDTLQHPRCPPFVSADGVIFELESLDPMPWQRFCAAIDIPSQIAGKGWGGFLLRYAKAMSPLPDELINAIQALTYLEIVALCKSSGMSVCPVRSLAERSRDQDAKRCWRQGPWDFDCERDFGLSLAARKGNHLPLAGIKVIESCRRIQGPLAGHVLALLGAEVIRIEPLGGDPLRGMPPMADGCSARFDALNRLKSIREIDLKSSTGQAEVKRLAADADVFLHNWAPGNAAKFNLDNEDLAKLNPAIIYAYAAGWATGGAEDPGLNAMPGTDFMTQAYSGVADQIAKASGTRGGSLFTVLDVLGGVVSAQGITFALLNRALNKKAGKVTTSLLSAAALLSADNLRQAFENPPIDHNQELLLSGVYQTRQGKIALELRSRTDMDQCRQALNIECEAELQAFQNALTETLKTASAAEWIGRLEAAGITVALVVEQLAELGSDERLTPHLIPGSYTKVNSPWSFL